ncbi:MULTISPECIES: hypothetical protein [unclassified Microbacterium]|uniref:hypothetical protein n=1 Tax=unclassified Microbacterium TaxID=2609290 RepID=UPI0011B00722|nr:MULTISPECIES: hypothetical protein [unclassified Microbacterium]
MSTRIRVRDGRAEITTTSHDTAVPGALAERPSFLTALVEAKGALLTWDATATPHLPDAEVHDARAASAWLDDVYGSAVADAVRRGDDTIVALDAPADPATVASVFALGNLSWARSWWPASIGIPALEPAILAAEIAVQSHRISHLLDDDDAVERAVLDAREAPSALAALPSSLAAEGAALALALDALAEDDGVELQPATTAEPRAEWALAAGGASGAPPATGIVVAHGSAPVRWSDVPAQTVDAGAEARWTLLQGTDAPFLHVVVAAVVGLPSIPALHARFGPAELELDVVLALDGSHFIGETAVPASALFLPVSARTLWVHDPSLASSSGDPESAEDRARVMAFAAGRLAAPDASLAERAAGARA